MLVTEGMRLLDGETRDAVERRAEAQLMTYQILLPGWRRPYDVDAIPEGVFDRLVDMLRDAPCPALDAGGRCSIHAHRPATCRLMGRSWIDDASGDRLDNDCPIQDRFPGYSSLPPTSLALVIMEDALVALDKVAASAGHVSTTVAGAIAAAQAVRPGRPR